MRRAAKRDLNEPDVIKELRDYGCLVVQLDRFDLLVQTPKGWILALEVKNPDGGRLTEGQKEMLKAGWKLHIVRTPEEAIAVVRRADER